MNAWDDAAIVLSVRPHGEHGGIAHLLTRDHGRHAGYVYGIHSKASRGLLEPGNVVAVSWRARVSDSLGAFDAEMVKSFVPFVLDDARKLSVLQSAVALLDGTLPDREPHPGLFDMTIALLQSLDSDNDRFLETLVRWETGFLSEMGFGLDLTRCAVSGAMEDIAYVSPKTGRGVSAHAAGIWKEKLLPCPAFLASSSLARREDAERVENPEKAEPIAPPEDILVGLRLTGYFLQKQVFGLIDRPLPPARDRLVRLLEEGALRSGAAGSGANTATTTL